jgi:elongation factor Ts
MNPKYIKPEEMPSELIEKESEIWRAQLAQEGKPAAMLEKILPGKEKKFREESALLTQPFVKDPSKTVGDLITEKVGKIGENIQVGEFVRFEL